MSKRRNPDHSIDALGEKCPMPLFKIAKAIRGLERGQVIEVRADDPCFPPDTVAWCQMMGHEIEIEEGGDGHRAHDLQGNARTSITASPPATNRMTFFSDKVVCEPHEEARPTAWRVTHGNRASDSPRDA